MNTTDRDQLAQIIAEVLDRTLELMALKERVEGVAVLPANKGEFLVDVVIHDPESDRSWGFTVESGVSMNERSHTGTDQRGMDLHGL